MATYGLKYQRPWASTLGVKGFLYIDQIDYVGDVTYLELKKEDEDDFKIEYKFKDWDERLIGLVAELNIINDKADFYELLPLLTAEEREYRVRIVLTDPVPQARILFTGFLNTDTNSQPMLRYQDINLVASSFISKLEYETTIEIETREGIHFIDLIDTILRTTGGEYNIRVNSSLFSNGTSLAAGQTLFNKNGIFTELFWEDNVKRKTNEEILEIIMIAFNCYLYWKDGYWYIERYTDIWDETPSYVEYTTGVAYDDTSTGVVVNTTRQLIDLHSLTFLGGSQTLNVDPGYKTIQLNLNIEDHLLLNLTVNDFSDVDDTTTQPPVPAPRDWKKWKDYVWEYLDSYLSISDAIKRVSAVGGYFPRQGLYTRFFTSLVDDTNSLRFTYKMVGLTSALPGFTTWDDWTYQLHWYLRLGSSTLYVKYNDGTSKWELQNLSEIDGVNTLSVQGSSFDNSDNVAEINISVMIGDLLPGLAAGNHDFIFCIGSEQAIQDGGSLIFPLQGIVGDVVITASGALEDNEIQGTINTKFLEKKEVDIDMIDLQNVNYIGGILKSLGATLDDRTDNWSDDNITFIPIVDHLLADLFRLYNVSRQRIVADIKVEQMFDPMTLFYDSKQGDKKFLLTGNYYFPAWDQANITLTEYDNETVVNLNG